MSSFCQKPLTFLSAQKFRGADFCVRFVRSNPIGNMQKKRNPADCVFLKCGADEVRIEFARTAVLVSPARCARGLLLRKSFPQKFRGADFCVHFVRSNSIRNMQKNATLRIAFFLKYGADEVRIEFARTAVLVSPARCARGLLLRKSFPQKFRDADFCVHFVRSNPIGNMQKNATLRIAFFLKYGADEVRTHDL